MILKKWAKKDSIPPPIPFANFVVKMVVFFFAEVIKVDFESARYVGFFSAPDRSDERQDEVFFPTFHNRVIFFCG